MKRWAVLLVAGALCGVLAGVQAQQYQDVNLADVRLVTIDGVEYAIFYSYEARGGSTPILVRHQLHRDALEKLIRLAERGTP